jgi:hypothetical protein
LDGLLNNINKNSGKKIKYFCYLGHHAKFRNPRTTFEITPLFRPKMP